ncbi:MAG: hypothetical protein LC772_10215, partial [Chloroflexi bacterium]|nr:hypothetical protein [Chloroflexota bacterium]
MPLSPAHPAAAPVQAAPEALFALHGLGGGIPTFETVQGDAAASGQAPRADDCIRECAAAGDAVIAAWKDLRALLALEDRALTDCPSPEVAGTAPPALTGWFPAMLDRIDLWERSLDSLRDWCAWRRVRSEALVAALSPLIAACETGTLSPAHFEAAYERGVYTAWLEAEISRDPLLSSFQRGLFEDTIRQFRECDETFTNLTRRELFARLASRVPHLSDTAAPHSEVGILKREMLKQRNHIALRALFGKIPNLLSRLKPCLLMSPMSVAQYLDPAHPAFDLVVFDEASQVPTCDAVGALARGSQAVIVGDPKQLPPTSFFGPGGADADPETESLQDLESILDDVLAISLPEEHLRWHYRSRHEGLIAFSNRLYYQNGLLTFPSPDDLEPAVKWRPIEGVYDRGGARQNRAEAEAVAAEVVRRLNDPVLQKQSIGIVTFGSPQQRLVEDLLDERLRENPALERYFAPDLVEPVFVKNLENVQGDERDVILFSIGYGPDSAGRVSMNFGPLNQLGGPRRLNVAVTRARTEMMVFSTLRADQLDLSRTSAQGVADLKAFLEYAERGKLPLDLGTAALSAGHDAGLEHEIALALRRRGHTVHTRVGSSGYRLDLAVVDPACPGRYLIGIETDGAMYRQAGTARDRDKLRQMILAQLGWKLHRVWAMEWWSYPARELRRIEDAIASARASAAGPCLPAVEVPVGTDAASPGDGTLAEGTPGNNGAGAVGPATSQGAVLASRESPASAASPTPPGSTSN